MKLSLITFLSVVALVAQAQSFTDLKMTNGQSAYDNVYTNYMLRYTSVSGKGTKSISGFTFNASIAEVDVEKGAGSLYWENVWLGDLIWRLANYNKPTANTQVFTSGLLGWFQFYVNVISEDRLIIAPGISTGDYIFGDNTAYTFEPNGYYIHIGPAVKASYLLNDSFWLDAFLNVDVGAGVKHSNDRSRHERIVGYPRPIFLNLTVNVVSTRRLFAGFRINQLVDRGDNKRSATRLDVNLGFRSLRFK
jgi:hypothetical protein